MSEYVLSVLVGKEVKDPSTVIEQGWVDGNTCNTGCLIKTKGVYSICDGKVIGIEKDPKNNTWSITVEYDSQHWIRYCCLSATGLLTGQAVSEKSSIGVANNGLMRLEYCTSEKSQFPVRVLNQQLYKQDPTPILFGEGISSEVS